MNLQVSQNLLHGCLIVGSHVQIETYQWLFQKCLVPLEFLILVSLGCQAIHSSMEGGCSGAIQTAYYYTSELSPSEGMDDLCRYLTDLRRSQYVT